MTVFAALLRAVNVGGTGKLPMAELVRLCEDAGFANVRTYIASGNAIFESALAEEKVRAALAVRLEAYAGKPVGVAVRTAAEMAAVAAESPFRDRPGNRVVAIFLDAPPPADALEHVAGRRDEVLALGRREIYVDYREGMADSRLRIACAAVGTARNMNTVAKLAALAGEA